MKRHLTRRGGWHPPLSHHARGQQTTPARLRQTHDLLSPLRPHAGGHPRYIDHLHPSRPAPLSAFIRRRLLSRASTSRMPNNRARRRCPVICDRKRFYSADPVCLIFGDNIFYGPGLGEIITPSRTTHRRRPHLRICSNRPRAIWRHRI